MDEKERHSKLQSLLERQKMKNQIRETSLLFDECIVALGDGTIILSEDKSAELYKTFEKEFKITFYGRIEWSLFEYEEIDLFTLKTTFANKDGVCNILWSHGSDPAIQANIDKILEYFDDVTAVSPDVWLYKEDKYIIEILHDGIIRVANKMKE